MSRPARQAQPSPVTAGANEVELTMSLKSALRRVSHFVTFVFGEGGWNLHDHEQTVVDAAIGALSTEMGKLVRAQLEQAFFVERSSNRISVLRFYEPDDGPAILDAAFQDRLMKVQIEIDGRKQVSHVTFYQGYIFTVEFKKPRQFYLGKRITVCDVSQGKPRESYTRSIDRLEHGSRDDE
jgi:hypothetical protein